MKQSLWELKYGFIGKRAHLILFDCVFSGFCYRSHHWHELMSQTFPVLVINKIYKLDVKITLYLQRTWHLQNKLLTFFFLTGPGNPWFRQMGKPDALSCYTTLIRISVSSCQSLHSAVPVAENKYLPFLIHGECREVISPERAKVACFLPHFYPCALVL